MIEVGDISVADDLERRTFWFIKLRWLAAGGVIGAAAIAHGLGWLTAPVQPIFILVVGLLVYNAILFLLGARLRAAPVRGEWGKTHPFARLLAPRTFRGLGDEDRVARAALFAFVQITIDFVFLTVLLHFCGGVASPFSVFYVFHVVIASILLSRRATYLQTTIGFLLYASVVLGELFGIIDHHPLGWLRPDAYRSWNVAATRLVVLGATLYLVSYLCSTIAVDLRERLRANVRLSREIAEDKRQLEVAYKALRESERTKSQYMRKVAHELRGPLGTIETALGVLLQGMAGGLSESSRDLIGRAQRRAGELAEVTRDLLALARAREAALEEGKATIELSKLVAEVVADLEPSAQHKGVTLSARVASGVVVVGDPAAIRQLVANIVENGIRYTEPGGSVIVALGSQGEGARLDVEDTGIGIAAEDLPRIFDEFYRGANARKYVEQGTGLGLAIVKAVAERHGGNVAIESNPGHGTRCVVTLAGPGVQAAGHASSSGI